MCIFVFLNPLRTLNVLTYLARRMMMIQWIESTIAFAYDFPQCYKRATLVPFSKQNISFVLYSQKKYINIYTPQNTKHFLKQKTYFHHYVT